jgi:hypothetical protein
LFAPLFERGFITPLHQQPSLGFSPGIAQEHPATIRL